MPEYQILNNRNTKIEYRIIAFILGVVLVVVGMLTQVYYEILIGFPVMYSSFFKKVTVVNDEGIQIEYKGPFFRHLEKVLFSDMTNIRIEDVNENTALHFLKNHMSRRLIFSKSDANNIISLAKSKNHRIYYDKIHE